MQGIRRAVLAAACAATTLTYLAPAEAEAARYGERTLRQGKSGSDVRVLQRYLGRVGHRTGVDGQFGPRTSRSVRRWERAEGRRPNAVVTRYEQRLLRKRVRTARRETASDDVEEVEGEKATMNGNGLAVPPASAPERVKAVIRAGNQIAKKPYKYGGGHSSWRDSGYDCSGSISYALRGGRFLSRPRDSSGFMRYGTRGRGKWITIRANAGHAYMIVAGLRFDTSARKRTGSRWTSRMRSARGYRGRHPAGY